MYNNHCGRQPLRWPQWSPILRVWAEHRDFLPNSTGYGTSDDILALRLGYKWLCSHHCPHCMFALMKSRRVFMERPCDEELRQVWGGSHGIRILAPSDSDLGPGLFNQQKLMRPGEEFRARLYWDSCRSMKERKRTSIRYPAPPPRRAGWFLKWVKVGAAWRVGLGGGCVHSVLLLPRLCRNGSWSVAIL